MQPDILRRSIRTYAKIYPSDPILFPLRSTPTKQLVDSFKGKFIGLEGIICAAKTTTGRAICDLAKAHGIGGQFYPEYVDRDLLLRYYTSLSANKRPNPVAHELQMHTLIATEEAYEKAKEDMIKSDHQRLEVLDRTRWGNCVFGALHCAYGNVSETQFGEYVSALGKSSHQTLDHIVYLDTDPQVALDRALNLRKNPEETTIPLEYMYNLEAGYFLHIVEQLQAVRNTTTNLVVVNNDAFSTAEEVLSIARGAPTRPFDVSPYSPEVCLGDKRRIRAFFQRIGMYYRHAH